MILAAGAGRRLRPYTDALPKALMTVDGDTTILDIALRNLAAVGIKQVVVVVGYAAEAVELRKASLERRHGVELRLVNNERGEGWKNAYSLWRTPEHMSEGGLVLQGENGLPGS